ncbi:MAG: GNAT family N-acetyltransferase [Ketobacter sp.]|nr:GNAT family N-acetyltransferase [Planctomycetota bacterium]MCP5017309.1 GNAT family N-acetyltransferase [Ketobacter sp.]
METERLILRNWKDEDLEPFADLNSDARVMEFFPSVLAREESDQLAEVIRNKIQMNGWGPWAVELKTTGEFIGVVGLQKSKSNLPFFPCVEVAWRLASAHWHKGYATEAAKASLNYASSVLNLTEVVSFTAKINVRSQAVMKKIGMCSDGYEFNHPDVPFDSPLCRHVLYKISFI